MNFINKKTVSVGLAERQLYNFASRRLLTDWRDSENNNNVILSLAPSTTTYYLDLRIPSLSIRFIDL